MAAIYFYCVKRSLRHAILTSALLLSVCGALAAEEPDGLRTLLATAVADEDRKTFDTLINVALRSWPGSRIDILTLIEDLRPKWLTVKQAADLNEYRFGIEEAHRRERERGLLYYVDPKYWSPKIELGGGTSSGDTNEQSIAFGLSLSRDFSGDWIHNLNVNFDFARRQGLTTRQRLDIIEETFWNVFRDGFVTNFTEFEIDRFSGFEWRVTQNLGVAYQLLEGGMHTLFVQGGPGIRISRVEEILESDGTFFPAFTREEFIARLAANYDLKLGDGITLSERASAAFGSISTRLDNNVTLSAQLNSSLSARLRFNVVYESDVPEGTSNTDTITRATLVYTF